MRVVALASVSAIFCIASGGQSCAHPASAVFLQLPATAIEGSSLLFRSLLRDACLEHGPIFDAFLNRLFNTLNWTVTEFVVVLKVLLLAGAVCHALSCHHAPCSVRPFGAPWQSVVGCQAAQGSTSAYTEHMAWPNVQPVCCRRKCTMR